MIRVLSVASEVFPLVKTGGLADVVGALPAALARHGVETRVMVPGYPAVRARLHDPRTLRAYEDLFGGPASLLDATVAGLRLVVVDAPHLFDRSGGPYADEHGRDWPDNWRRFAALGAAAADIGRGAAPAFVPAVVHGHDWTAGLACAYLRYGPGSAARTVMTIHNLAFQGQFPAAVFGDLGLPPEAFAVDGVEYYGGVGYLKAGIFFADAITTVSPTYADEICRPEMGMGLDGLLRARAGALSGILNGIDTAVWNPAADGFLQASYTAASLDRRARNKRAVEKRFALAKGDGPIYCVVSRLTWQKGMDILVEAVDPLVAAGGRLAVLGSGEPAIEAGLEAARRRHEGRVGVVVGYDETLSHLLQGGADAILIPSRFEPCGLTQFYGLRYGCVPVVTRVGGLADTIVDANEAALAAGVATGIQFLPVDAAALVRAVRRAGDLYKEGLPWWAMQVRGMSSDVSWSRSAARYAALYRRLAGKA